VITGATITGPNVNEFSWYGPVWPVTLAPGIQTTIDVVFTPGATGLRTATLTVTDNTSSSPHLVPLSGTGTAPVVGLSPTGLSFPAQIVYSPSVPKALTVNNTGTGDLLISTVTVTGANAGDFRAVAGALPLRVAAGSSGVVNVTFTPGGTGARTAVLSLIDNAPGSPHTVTLSGIGQ
jgi:hypothetical protein